MEYEYYAMLFRHITYFLSTNALLIPIPLVFEIMIGIGHNIIQEYQHLDFQSLVRNWDKPSIDSGFTHSAKWFRRIEIQ